MKLVLIGFGHNDNYDADKGEGEVYINIVF